MMAKMKDFLRFSFQYIIKSRKLKTVLTQKKEGNVNPELWPIKPISKSKLKIFSPACND
jgi:hypothetical protein